jgi:hypothetical protein
MPRILIIDGDPEARERLAVLLDAAGYATEFAAGLGRHARRMAH